MEIRINIQVERWSISRLIPRITNPRTHTPEQVAQIAASIREWGWTNPILDHRSVENWPITTFLHENGLFWLSPQESGCCDYARGLEKRTPIRCGFNRTVI